MTKHSRVCAHINLKAIKENLVQLHRNIEQSDSKEEKQIMAVVKANAYGHGLLPVANYLEMENLKLLWGFGVATAAEAVALRQGGIQKPILVLGCVFPEEYEELFVHTIIPTVYTYQMAKDMNEEARKRGSQLSVHVKIDTGMGRLGFLPTAEHIGQVKDILKLEYIKIDGVFTHFARADEADQSFTKEQQQIFLKFIKEASIEADYMHSSNSAATIDMPEFSENLVRPGLSIYGIYPFEEKNKEKNKKKVKLTPALRLNSHISLVKEVEKGTPIGYGSTYITSKPTKVATIPVGYGDGYPRSLSNKGEVLIAGKRCPIIGRICMDQFMVDVTDIPRVKMGDEVVLIGPMGEEAITVDELADISGRFSYEFLCCLTNRIPRIYHEE